MDRRRFLATSVAASAVSGALLAGGAPAARAAAASADRPKQRPKKSLILGMVPKALPLEERFAMARRVGFEGMEIPPTEDEAEQKALRAAADKAGLPIHSIIFGGWDKPLTHPDPAVREEGTEKLRKGLACARAVGADVLLLVPGIVNDKVRYVEAYERSRQQVRKVIPLAQKLKVTIAIEEVWNNFLLSPMEFAKYVDDFRSPWVRAYFDVGNVVKNGWPEDWIRTLARRIVRVHLKDFKRKEQKFVPLGEGDVAWAEVRRALDEIGFASYMTAELPSGDEAYLQEVSSRIDKILDGTLQT